EVALMLRVQRDEPGAFAEMVACHGQRIFARFYRSFQDRQEAEDLTQDVFLRLYRSRKRYEPRAKFSTWLFHITQNVARNAFRNRRRRPCIRLETLAGPTDGMYLEGLLFDRSEEPSRPVERAEVA